MTYLGLRSPDLASDSSSMFVNLSGLALPNILSIGVGVATRSSNIPSPASLFRGISPFEQLP